MEVADAEAYRYDGEVIAKAKAMGKEGLVSIMPRQVGFLMHLGFIGFMRLSFSQGGGWCDQDIMTLLFSSISVLIWIVVPQLQTTPQMEVQWQVQHLFHEGLVLAHPLRRN